MRILGIDSSTSSTGYAVLDGSKLISYGTIKTPKKADLIDKIIYVEEHLKQIIKAKKVEVVIIEDLAVTRNAAITKALAGLLYDLLVEFRKREMLVVQVRPSQWRKTCNIKGKKREELKQNAIIFAKTKYGIDVNDDEADAIGIANYGTTLKIEIVN